MKHFRFGIIALSALLAASMAIGIRAEDAPIPDVIVAKIEPQMVLVWRANAAIARIAGNHPSDAALDSALLAAGEHIMFEEAARAESKTKSIALKLVFFHDADDPRYKIETLAGITPLGTLRATVAALRVHDRAWSTALGAGKIPAGFDVDLDRDATHRAAR